MEAQVKQHKFRLENYQDTGIIVSYIGEDESNFNFKMHMDGSIRKFKGESYVHVLPDVLQIRGVPVNPTSVYSPYYDFYEALISMAKSIVLTEEAVITYGRD